MEKLKQKLTPEQAAAGVRPGEELIWANCPHCTGLLAAYISRDAAIVVAVSNPEVPLVGN